MKFKFPADANNAAIVQNDRRIRVFCAVKTTTPEIFSIYTQVFRFEELKNFVEKSPGEMLMKRLRWGREEYYCSGSGKETCGFNELYDKLVNDPNVLYRGDDEGIMTFLRDYCQNT